MAEGARGSWLHCVAVRKQTAVVVVRRGCIPGTWLA